MPDYIGSVAVPVPDDSGTSFPLTPDFGFGMSQTFPTATHRFGSRETLSEQVFVLGAGPRRFQFKRQTINRAQRALLVDFYESVRGSYNSFTYNAPNPDGSSTPVKVVFDTAPLNITELVNACQAGITFVEVADADSTPTYSVASACMRFPSDTLETALLQQQQTIIPLVQIRVRDLAIDDIFLSDRRVTVRDVPDLVGGSSHTHTYLPRITGIGDGEVLMSQSITGASDNVQITLGNADRVLTQLCNRTDLKYATITLSLYHVESGILLQLWRGFINSYVSDGTPSFPLTCSDGLRELFALFPVQTHSRQCYKKYKDGFSCPFGESDGHGGTIGALINDDVYPLHYVDANGNPADATGKTLKLHGQADTCDFYLDTENGCRAHSMLPYFGGIPGVPEAIVPAWVQKVKKSDITATSIVSDTMWGKALPLVFCNDGGTTTSTSSLAIGAGPKVFAVPAGLPIIANMIARAVSGGTPAAFMEGLVTAYSGTSLTVNVTVTNTTTTHADWQISYGDPAKSFMHNAVVAGIIGGDTASADSTGLAGMGALGIVGAGPIAEYRGLAGYFNADGVWTYVSPLLDSVTPIGLSVDLTRHFIRSNIDLGLREVPGDDPAVPYWDDFSPARLTTPSFSLGQAATWGSAMAAGVAFCELVIQQVAALPTTPEQHTIQIPIAKGLSGRIWSAEGVASWVDGLTNPFWVAANCFLRALGLTPDKRDNSDKIAAQLDKLDLPSLVKGDGTGCAEICDLVVAKVVGDGSEKQFRFQGAMADQKPFRDWLSEILACALGYYTFEWGKLRFGIRENAGAVSAFTLGNTLYQSLRLAPVDASFEKLEVSFADEQFLFQGNSATYSDKDHAEYYGRGTSPLTARMNQVGLSNISQALRYATTRVREEVGGILPFEWKNARNVSFKSTILGLDTGVGQVASLSHPDVPGAVGTVSVSGVDVTLLSGDPFQTYHDSGDPTNPLLNDFYLVDKEILIGGVVYIVASVTDPEHLVLTEAGDDGTDLGYSVETICFRITGWKLMRDYSLVVEGRTVTDSMYNLLVGPKPVDVKPDPIPAVLFPVPLGEWAPFQAHADDNDAIFPKEWNFDISQSDGLIVTGKLPENQFIPGCPPVGLGPLAVSGTGGSVPGNRMLRVTVCARNAKGTCSPPAKIRLVPTPSGTDTSFTFSDIIWPPVGGLVDHVVFVSDKDDLICWQQTGSGTPDSITVNGPFQRSTWALPNADIQKVRLKSKVVYHPGPVQMLIDSASGTSIVSAQTIDVAALDDWTGRALVIVGRPNDICPFANFNITAFAPATGTFTVDRSVDGIVQAGDAFAICFLGYDNSATPYVFADAGLSNACNLDETTGEAAPHTGLTPSWEKGFVLRVLAGTNRGMTAKIVDNDATSYTLDKPFLIDATSIVIVEDAAWWYQTDSTTVANADPMLPSEIALSAAGQQWATILVGGFTVDGNGHEPVDGDGPFRMLYVFPKVGSVTGDAAFAPARPKYGLIQLKNIEVTDPTAEGTAEIHALYAYVDELKIEKYAKLTADIDGTSDPVIASVTENGGGMSKYGHFAVNDFIVFNDTGGYECGRITAVASDYSTFTIKRHWNGDPDATHAHFASLMGTHAIETEIYKLDIKHDSIKSKEGSLVSLPVEFGSAAKIPNDITTTLPHACVVAAMTATVSGGKTSDWTVHNFSNPTAIDTSAPSMPGIRTHIGGAYIFPQFKGKLVVGVESLPWHVQDWAAGRCFYAQLSEAAQNDESDTRTYAVKITLLIHFPGADKWAIVNEIKIDAGALNNWATTTPTRRNHPFSPDTWPVMTGADDGGGSADYAHRPIEGDALIKWRVDEVGSGVDTDGQRETGSDLTVTIQT